jgi:hypothetical protein
MRAFVFSSRGLKQEDQQRQAPENMRIVTKFNFRRRIINSKPEHCGGIRGYERHTGFPSESNNG